MKNWRWKVPKVRKDELPKPGKPPARVPIEHPQPATPELAAEIFDGEEVTPGQIGEPDFCVESFGPKLNMTPHEIERVIEAGDVRRRNASRLISWFFELFKNGVHFGTRQTEGVTGVDVTTHEFLLPAGAEYICQLLDLKPESEACTWEEGWKVFGDRGWVVIRTKLAFPNGCRVWAYAARHPRESQTLNAAIQAAVDASLVAVVKRAFGLSSFFVPEPDRVSDTKVWEQETGQIHDPRFAGDEGVIHPSLRDIKPPMGPTLPKPKQTHPIAPYAWNPADALSRRIADVVREIASRRGVEFDDEYLFGAVQQAGAFSKRDDQTGQPKVMRPPGDPNQIRSDPWRKQILTRLTAMAADLRQEAERQMEGYTPDPDAGMAEQPPPAASVQAPLQPPPEAPQPPEGFYQPGPGQ
jgi:hypothetical protein